MFRTRPLLEDIFDSPSKTAGSIAEPRTDFADGREQMDTFKLPRKRAAEHEVETVLRALASVSLSASRSPDDYTRKVPRNILNAPPSPPLGQLEVPVSRVPVSRALPAPPPDPAAQAEVPDLPLVTTATEVEMLCDDVVSEEQCADADWPIAGLEAAPLMAVEPVDVQVAILDQSDASPRSASARQREADMPSLEREARLCLNEHAGELCFRLLRPSAPGNQVHVAEFLALLQLREVICAQLPAMDRAYATQLLFRQDHRSIVCVRAGIVVGGITYRPFVHGEPDGGYAELVFCVVSTAVQVQGLGTRLMNRFKAQLVSDGCFHILTYADNSAIGFFKQHGYSSAIGLPDVRWYAVPGPPPSARCLAAAVVLSTPP
jgi:ribosomal protein S18 acetylase RimI-like enzyme